MSTGSTQGARVCHLWPVKGSLGQAPRAQVCPTAEGQGAIQLEPIRVPFDLVFPQRGPRSAAPAWWSRRQP